jgi:hypothetical protein
MKMAPVQALRRAGRGIDYTRLSGASGVEMLVDSCIFSLFMVKIFT